MNATTTLYDLVTYTKAGERWVIVTFATLEEAALVRNGYRANGTDVVIVKR
jgi:hypothetical protein